VSLKLRAEGVSTTNDEENNQETVEFICVISLLSYF